MGSRLGTIVRTEKGWEVYYDHWAAQSVGADLALDGCDQTLERVRAMTRFDVSDPAGWKDADWMEGTLYIDLIEKCVYWAEESEGLYLPRIINALIDKTWPGWKAYWSAEGTYSTLSAAGVDPNTIFKPEDGKVPWSLEDSPWFGPWDEIEPEDALMVALENDDHLLWRQDVSELVSFGPENIHTLAFRVRDEMDKKGIRMFSTCCEQLWDTQEREGNPMTGVFIDFRKRTFQRWSLCDEDMDITTFQALWPGWILQSRGDYYEWFEHISQRKMRDWQDDVRQCAYYIGRDIGEGERQNPAMRIAQAMSKQGHQVELDPVNLDFVPAQRRQGADIVMETLLDLSGREIYPPAHYVSRFGERRCC